MHTLFWRIHISLCRKLTHRIEQLILNQLLFVQLSTLKLRRTATIPFALVAVLGCISAEE